MGDSEIQANEGGEGRGEERRGQEGREGREILYQTLECLSNYKS
jgi:hypothetical protein